MKQSAPRIQYLAERMAHACHCMAKRTWQAVRCARCRSADPVCASLRGGARSATQPLTTERPAAEEHLTADCCGASWGCDGEKVPERQFTTPERDRGEIELAGVREHESSISPTRARVLLFVNMLASGRAAAVTGLDQLKLFRWCDVCERRLACVLARRSSIPASPWPPARGGEGGRAGA